MRLRRAIDRVIPVRDGLEERAATLSATYRSGDAPPLDTPAAAGAYAAIRMPATFAAETRAFVSAAERSPGFEPATHLDVGGGTGAAAWAARTAWPSLDALLVVDREAAALELGRRLAAASGDEVLGAATWRTGSAGAAPDRADLVTAGYVLGELDPTEVATTIDALWAATRGLLVLVEPGSRAGFARIVAARDRVVAAGGRVVAPCPGPQPCPVASGGPAWCHFLARLDRSPVHRRAKGGTRSFEDEPFSYVAVARPELVVDPRPRVVLGRPRQHPGRVELRICAEGRIDVRTVSRREGDAWRRARDLEWGDPVDPAVLGPMP